MVDYAKELASYEADGLPLEAADRAELIKLATLQKDIAIGSSAEDFIRHPFFKSFENKMNDMIIDTKGEVSALLKKPETTIADLKALQAGVDKIVELKAWLNKHVLAGRYAAHAIAQYETDTEEMNTKIQEAVDQSNEQPQ